MQFRSFFFESLDNVTKGIILLFDLFFKYFTKLCSLRIFSFVYFFKNEFVLKRFFFFSFFYLFVLIVISFFPFFMMLFGELLVFSCPIIIFCFVFLNFFLFNCFVDYFEEIELMEFFVQTIELILWSNFKYIYMLFYVIYIYRFLLDFFVSYFNHLLSFMIADWVTASLCKIFVVRRYLNL